MKKRIGCYVGMHRARPYGLGLPFRWHCIDCGKRWARLGTFRLEKR